MQNVMVTGASAPLGRHVLEQLRRCDGLDHIVGVEPKTSSEHLQGVELVSFNSGHRDLLEFMTDNDIDSVIHCGMAPDRDGSRDQHAEAKVIDCMRLGAAIAHEDSPVRSWIVASSSAVYPVCSQAPLMYREEVQLNAAAGTFAASILEAEDYARDVATRCPHLDVAILRLQELVGEGVHGPISELLKQPILPNIIGFDAPLQLLSIEDAVRALVFAAKLELAGVYNVASVGTLRMSEVTRELNRFALPVIPVETGLLGLLAGKIGVPHVPEGMLDLLRFGHAVDIAKLEAAGFEPEYDQPACLASLRH